MVAEEQHSRRARHVAVADRQVIVVTAGQQGKSRGVGGPYVSFQFYKIIHEGRPSGQTLYNRTAWFTKKNALG